MPAEQQRRRRAVFDAERPRPPQPLLLGRHLLELGLKPGPRVGEILKIVYEQQLDNQVRTLGEAIEAAKRLL